MPFSLHGKSLQSLKKFLIDIFYFEKDAPGVHWT